MKKQEKIGSYFLKEKNIDFIKSGCDILDLVLGGGWAIGRFSNVVGDASTGKSAIAGEASTNFNRQYPKGRIFMHEVESAYDFGYAEMMGAPINDMIFVRDEIDDSDTVEGLFNYVEKEVIAKAKKEPSLYILDSQDFLTDKSEKGRKIDEGTYGGEKNKLLNRFYRQHVRDLEKARVHFMVLSQTREKIGVSFGRKWRVTGEGALKFAASQRIQLADLGKINKTIDGITYSVGMKIKANCFKNKVGIPYKTCEFPFYTGFGIDNNEASLNFLEENKALDGLGISSIRKEIKRLRDEKDIELEKKIEERVAKVWNDVLIKILPKRSKYGD